ncbi:MAG: hypothetical protein ACE5JA_11160, partial [bacterium]
QNLVTADVIEVAGEGTERRHLLGFSGVGVFGDTPRFTENRFVKHYKGLLGTLLGDLGPFLVGINFALMRHHLNTLRGRGLQFRPAGENVELPMAKYVSIIILNGDLSEDFPLAKGMPLGDGDFKVVTIRDRGFTCSYRQLISCWNGSVFKYAKELSVTSFRTRNLQIVPRETSPYMVNIDGLVSWARGPIHYSISGQVKLVSGIDRPPLPA